jgi:ribosome-binding factor A
VPGHRPARIAELVHAEVARLLREDIKDPRVADVSLTHVVVSRDLGSATLSYLPLGGGPITSDLREGLADAARRLRGPVGRALGIRHAPELRFTPDANTETAVRVTSLLSRLEHERRSAELPTETEDPE